MKIYPKKWCVYQKALLIGLFLLFPLIAPNASFPAEASQKRIDKKDLLLKFKKGETVQGVVIQGPDLIEIMKITDDDIRIEGSTIEGGLDFLNLPTVKNQIQIMDSEIRMNRDNFYAVEAENTHFSKRVFFLKTVFSGKADFAGATFDEEAVFLGATFRGQTYFSFTTFHKFVSFLAAVFENRLMLRMIDVREYADFRDVIIGQLDFDSSESRTVVAGRIDFRRAIVSEAHFQDIIFEKDVDFSDAIFVKTVFRDLIFEKNAYFLRTKFRLQTAIENVRFKQDADFREAHLESNQKFLISYVLFNTLKIKWSQLPALSTWVNDSEDSVKSFLDIEREGLKKIDAEEMRVKIGGVERLSEVVLGLEGVFRRDNALNDANAAYYSIKTLELKQSRKEKPFRDWFSEQPLWIVWWVTTGFGMQLPWILAWCLGFNLFFTLLYCVRGNLKPAPQADDTFKLRILDFPKRYFTEAVPEHKVCGMKQLSSMFWFSAVVLMKVGHRTQVIEGKVVGIDYKWIVRLEWLIGLYLLAALSFTLQNVVPVVNKLVTGVF